jgi:hypothetical protein
MVYQGFRHTVNRTSPAFIALMLAATPALGDGPKDSAAATPRQVAHCMMKRLRADRSESYRDAFKTCKQELAAESDRNADIGMNASNEAAAAKQD